MQNFSVAPRPTDPDAEEAQQQTKPPAKEESEDEKFPRISPPAAPEPVPENL
jgi:hypothetical protein